MTGIRVGLTFDDVLLVPKRSSALTRKTIDVSSYLTPRIKLHIPIIASNMDTVCEAEMAITMARLGGMGFIHRFLPIAEQVREVVKVKRAESVVIENPYTTTRDKLVSDVRRIMEEHEVSGLIVIDENRVVEGIVTARDVMFAEKDWRVEDVMTKDVITERHGISLDRAKDVLYAHRIEKLPLVDERRRLMGLVTVQDIVKRDKHPFATKDSKGRLVVGAAIGVKGDYLVRAEQLLDVGVDVILIDIAHGHSDLAISAVKKIKREFGDVDVVAGNVATEQGTRDLIAAGADGVKVGVGPGSICVTRLVAGAGVPQLTAIMDAARAAHSEGIPLIADGGVRKSGDVVKALMAGASTVMIGSLFAGTTESPGMPILRNGKKYKVIRGMASFGAALGREAREKKGSFDENDVQSVVPEGVEALVVFKGSVVDVVHQLVGGLKSGLSYCGGNSIEEARKNAEFIRITDAGRYESKAHDVEVI